MKQTPLWPLLVILFLQMAHAQNIVPTNIVTCGSLSETRFLEDNPSRQQGQTDFCRTSQGQDVYAIIFQGGQWKHPDQRYHRIVVGWTGGWRFMSVTENETSIGCRGARGNQGHWFHAYRSWNEVAEANHGKRLKCLQIDAGPMWLDEQTGWEYLQYEMQGSAGVQ